MANQLPDDEGQKEIRVQRNAAEASFHARVAAFNSMAAAFFGMIKGFWALLEFILSVIIDAIRDGLRVIARLVNRIIVTYLKTWLRRLRGKKKKTPPPPEDAAAKPADRVEDVPVALREAHRQAKNAHSNALQVYFMAVREVLPHAARAADQADEAAYQANASQRASQENQVGHLFFDGSGLIYSGSISRGSAEGFGVLKREQKEIYRGEISGNRRHGYGIDTDGHVNRYQGQFVAEIRQGIGQIETQHYSYTGEFHKGSATGLGIMDVHGSAFSWNRYEGEFKDGQPHGYGIGYFHNGQRHYGEFKFGEPYGYGIREFPNGSRRAGRWEGGACDTLLQPVLAET